MRILICEDELSARRNLLNILKDTAPQAQIAGCTESVVETVEWLGSNPPPDIIFMDIQLSDGIAFEIFKRIAVDSPVIFTTAYDEYALKAFKANAIDYLLKPVDAAELSGALEKFSKLTRRDILDYLSRLSAAENKNNYAERIIVPYRDKLLPVEVSDISFIHATSGQNSITLSDGTSYRYNKPLEQIGKTLDPARFFRANKQFLISKNKIRSIAVWPDSRLHITMDVPTPEHIFVSKNRATVFRRWIMER